MSVSGISNSSFANDQAISAAASSLVQKSQSQQFDQNLSAARSDFATLRDTFAELPTVSSSASSLSGAVTAVQQAYTQQQAAAESSSVGPSPVERHVPEPPVSRDPIGPNPISRHYTEPPVMRDPGFIGPTTVGRHFAEPPVRGTNVSVLT